jgi:hypothetical protein
MTDAYVIEIGEEAIGLVVRETENVHRSRSYRFYASKKGFHILEGKMFPNPESARRSAIYVSEQKLQASPVIAPLSPPSKFQNAPVDYRQVEPINLAAAC